MISWDLAPNWGCELEAGNIDTVQQKGQNHSEQQSISFPSLILSLLYTASSHCWNLAVAMSSNNLCLPLASMRADTDIHSTLPPP